jgi:hypothetical protein
VAVGLIVGMKLAALNPWAWKEIAIGVALYGGAAAGLLAVAFRYRLRIDARGIWRRRLVHWDLWPWEAFEAGLVRHGKLGDQLTYPAKGWYWRTISASVLSPADRPPADAAEADRRFALLDQSERECRKLARVLGHVFVWGSPALGALVADVWNQPNPLNWDWADWAELGLAVARIAGVLGLQMAMCFGGLFYLRRDFRRRRAALLRWQNDGAWAE